MKKKVASYFQSFQTYNYNNNNNNNNNNKIIAMIKYSKLVSLGLARKKKKKKLTNDQSLLNKLKIFIYTEKLGKSTSFLYLFPFLMRTQMIINYLTTKLRLVKVIKVKKNKTKLLQALIQPIDQTYFNFFFLLRNT